jgi:hypothetical protein
MMWGVGLVHPIPQAGIADTQVFGERGDRFIALAGKFDGALAELDRVRCRHEHFLPRRHGSYPESPQVGCTCYGWKLRAL